MMNQSARPTVMPKKKLGPRAGQNECVQRTCAVSDSQRGSRHEVVGQCKSTRHRVDRRLGTKGFKSAHNAE
jgi:hypothetical protein